jgi:hypothetical protein
MWQPTSPKGDDPSQPASSHGHGHGHGHGRTLSMKQKNPGRWFAQTIKLKKECAEEYKACHAKVWPEVLKQIKDCNIEDCTPCLFALSLAHHDGDDDNDD